MARHVATRPVAPAKRRSGGVEGLPPPLFFRIALSHLPARPLKLLTRRSRWHRWLAGLAAARIGHAAAAASPSELSGSGNGGGGGGGGGGRCWARRWGADRSLRGSWRRRTAACGAATARGSTHTTSGCCLRRKLARGSRSSSTSARRRPSCGSAPPRLHSPLCLRPGCWCAATLFAGGPWQCTPESPPPPAFPRTGPPLQHDPLIALRPPRRTSSGGPGR